MFFTIVARKLALYKQINPCVFVQVYIQRAYENLRNKQVINVGIACGSEQ